MTRFTIPTLLALVLAGCDGTALPETQMGVAFRANVPAEQARDFDTVGITSIQVDVLSIEANVDGEWVTLSDTPQMIELMVLETDSIDAIDSALVPAGHYTQVRLILGDDSALVFDDEALPLSVPSGMQTGLKLPLDSDIEEGKAYELTLAFDLDQNVVQNARGWQLKPVLHVESLDEVPPPILEPMTRPGEG